MSCATRKALARADPWHVLLLLRSASAPARLCSRRAANPLRRCDPDEVPPRRVSAAAALVQHPLRHAHGAPAGAPPRHGAARRARRSRAALPDGAHRPGGLRGRRDPDPGGSPRHLQPLAADAALPRAPARAGARYPLPHLLQVRGRQPSGEPQAEHGGRAGLLQQEGRPHAPLDRDRRGPVGERARVRVQADRARVQGLHGQDLVRAEAEPALDDPGLGRGDRPEPVAGHPVRPRDPRGAPGLAGEPAACPTLTRGVFAYDFGDTSQLTPLVAMHTLGHDFVPAPIHAGGLRYHGVAPLISQLVRDRLIRAEAYLQNDVFASAVQFAGSEGILPAPEAAHAIHGALRVAKAADQAGEKKTILFNLSGHGHFDMGAYDKYFAGELEDVDLDEGEIERALQAIEGLPTPA